MTRLSTLIPGLLVAFHAVAALAAEPSRVEAVPREPLATIEFEPQRPPLFIVAPTADAAVGHYSLFSTELGGAAFVSVIPRLRVGLSAAFSQNVTNGLEGCSTMATCVRSWKRVAASGEYHYFPTRRVDFWWGAQTGAEWREADVRATVAGWVRENRVYMLVQPGIGLDIVASTGRSVYGIGFYAGLPLSIGAHDASFGGLVGIRGILGVN